MPKRKTYPGTIEKRGRGFRVILYAGGERHTFTLRGVDRSEVEQFARDKHAVLQEQFDRTRLGLPGAVALPALLDRYDAEKIELLSTGSQRSYRSTLELVRRWLAARHLELTVDEVRRAHVKDFLTWIRVNPLRGKRAISNLTIQRHRRVLHAVFSFAEEIELRVGNPVTKVRPPKADPRDPVILSDAQLEALLSKCEDPILRTYVLVLAETGLRAESEALHLQWTDLDLEEGFIRVVSGRHDHRTKSGKGRWVPMTPRLRRALSEHAARFRLQQYDGERSRWVFHYPVQRRGHKAGVVLQPEPDFRGCLRELHFSRSRGGAGCHGRGSETWRGSERGSSRSKRS